MKTTPAVVVRTSQKLPAKFMTGAHFPTKRVSAGAAGAGDVVVSWQPTKVRRVAAVHTSRFMGGWVLCNERSRFKVGSLS